MSEGTTADAPGADEVFWRAREVAYELVQTMPLDATPRELEALAAKVRAEADQLPEGREMALAAAGHLVEAMVRRRVVFQRPRIYGGSGGRGGNKVLFSMVALVTRFRDHTGQTLHFTFEGGQRRASRARNSFIDPQDMPADFDGDEGWFQLEQISTKPWPYWRAVCQVQPPAGPITGER